MRMALTTIEKAKPAIFGGTDGIFGIQLVFRDDEDNSKTYSTLTDFASNDEMKICDALMKLTDTKWPSHLSGKKVRLIFNEDNKVVGFAHETKEKLTVMLDTAA